MKKGVNVWGLIAVLIATGLLFMGIVSTEVIVADVNNDIAATNVNVTHTSPKGDLELVRGDDETDTRTKNKTEWIKVTPTSTHDMAVTNVNTTPSSPDLEQPTVIYVTVTNEGEQQEDNVSVKVYVDSAQIGSTQYISLAPDSSNTTTFLWTSTTAKAYSVKGEVEIVNGEIDVKDNTKSIEVRVSAVPTPTPTPTPMPMPTPTQVPAVQDTGSHSKDNTTSDEEYGVVPAEDVSGGLKQSVDDAELFDKNKITDQQKQQEILNMVNSHRGSLPAELILAIIHSEGGEGAFHADGWNYNYFYRESDGPWAQPTNGDGIMQVTTASGYHERSGPYTHDWAGYDHAINDGCDYLLALYNNYGTHVQSTLHYNTGPNSLYIYLGKNWGDRDYLSHVAGHLSNFVPNTYALQNQNLVNALNQGQDILDKYLDEMDIATGQSVGYYGPYQTQLDSELHNIIVTSLIPLSVEMNVPVYKQGYPSPWYNDQLGTCSVTIGSHGCAITSIAMVFKYYGVETDPRDMNNWLKQNGNAGYDDGCNVRWPFAAGRSGGTVQWAGRYDYISIPADLNRINSELNNEYPVIAEVRLSGGQHFVVITGYSGSTYSINDPAYGDKSTINGRYGNPASAIYGIRLYHGTTVDTPIPLSGDLYGDGKDITGTFNPSTNAFTFKRNEYTPEKTVIFGIANDLPVIGDWDGNDNGKDEIGIYRPDDGGQSTFYLVTRDWASLPDNAGDADKTIPFGSYPDNIPIAGDWDGDGDDDLGGYYSGTFTFYLYLLNLGSSTATSYRDVSFGDPGDIPLIGDWDNDGDDDVAVCRKYDLHENPTYYFDLGLTGGVEYEIGPYEWGNNEDIPIAGRWNAGSGDKIGVYRPSTEGFLLNYDIPATNQPPNTPSIPSGPSSGYTGTSYGYSTSATDPDGDQVKYTFDWGDGTTSETGFVNSGTSASKSHSWSSAGTYYVKAKTTDSKGASSGWSSSKIVTIATPNQPPNTPSIPSGPSSGYTGTSYSYSTSATDPDGDQVKYTFDWGDGTTSETGFVNSGTSASKSHSWSSAGTYYVKAKATDSNKGASSGWSGTKTVTITTPNNPPNTPSIPSGPTSGQIGISYPYSTVTTDPNSDNIYYWFDWGDGTNSGWIGPYPSETSGSASKEWNDPGTYNVKAKAKDEHGAESSPLWSDSLPVCINGLWENDPINPCKKRRLSCTGEYEYQNKDDGTICDCTASNTLKRCNGGVCTDTGICDATTCGADATCDGKRPGDSCGGGTCDSNCKCGPVGEDYGIFSAPLWFVDTNGDHIADDVFGYGFAGATPLVGDFNQDGADDIAVFSAPLWFVDTNGDHIADDVFGYGFAGATPLVGDINQDGTDDIAVFCDGLWFVDTNGDHIADDVFGYGFAGATPLVGDINQDGTDDIAVFSDGLWFVDTNGDHLADDVFGYGFAGATPLVGDINQDGTDDIAVFSAPLWFVDTNGDHLADDVFGYGFAGATPIVGNFG